jgi:hypothetical protein
MTIPQAPIDALNQARARVHAMQRSDAGQDITMIHTNIKGNTMDFSQALQALKRGKAVHRTGWNGKGMFIVLMPALQLPPYNTQGTERKVNDRTAKWIGADAPLDCQPYVAMYTAQKQWQPGWLCSQNDMLAEDWEIFEGVPT